MGSTFLYVQEIRKVVVTTKIAEEGVKSKVGNPENEITYLLLDIPNEVWTIPMLYSSQEKLVLMVL